MTVANFLMGARGRRAQPEERTRLTMVASAARLSASNVNADVLAHPVDPARALSALRVIPVPSDRGDWLKLALAANAAGVEVDGFLEWARSGEKYTTDEEELKVWNSADPARPGGTKAGTLFFVARQHGWEDPARVARLAQPANDETAQPADMDQQQLTDMALAGYYASECGAGFRHDHSAKQWRAYRSGSWALCRKGEQIEAMKQLAGRLMARYLELVVSNPRGLDLRKCFARTQRAQSVHGIDAALKLAQSDPALAISAEELDTDPDLFNAANCVVHLPTGTALPHDPAQMLSRQSPVPYDPDAQCPLFFVSLDQWSCCDPAWVESMQRMLGYVLSGHLSEEKLFFWLGRGANGKSVLANIVRYILGTYAATVPPAFMMQSKRDGGGATPELAMLAGVRGALANETESGSKLSAQTVKVAVSTEHITARQLYGAPFTFKPTHKLLIRGNHRPIVTDDDEGIWRRIVLVPFELDVPAAERDPGLEARLLTEAPGILRWMVEGFAKWQRDGLQLCKRMTDASLAYRKESDLLLQWLTEHCDTGPGFAESQKLAYGHFRFWCNEQGLRQFSKFSFTRGLTERGFGEGREGGGDRRHTYIGLKLRNV